MKNFQIILNDSDGPDNVVWIRSDMDISTITSLTGKFVSELPNEYTEFDGIDGEFPRDFKHLIKD